MTINLENKDEVKKFISTLGDSPKLMTNGENLTVNAVKNEFGSLELRTNQENGWVRINYYSAEGEYEGESYDGRWK